MLYALCSRSDCTDVKILLRLLGEIFSDNFLGILLEKLCCICFRLLNDSSSFHTLRMILKIFKGRQGFLYPKLLDQAFNVVI